jgi:NAD(P)-dependent dehydrogenase (short-subunit alcohol dehydrogenase family)
MHGKTVLITGANSGIGFETAKALIQRGASIIMVCRDQRRGQIAQSEVRAAVADAIAPILLIADLSSQASIHQLSTTIHKRFQHIDVLINNAGGVFSRREFTVDGIEKTLAVNHLAPFLLTHLLLDLLKAAPAGRIVNIASNLHNASPDFFDNLQGEQKYNFILAHKQAKLGLILFTYELARRLKDTHVTVNCAEPGPVATRFGDNLSGLAGLFLKVMKRLPLFQTPEKGARMPVYVASSPEVTNVTGKYFIKYKQADSKPITYNIDIAAKHWAISEKFVGLGTPAMKMANAG